MPLPPDSLLRLSDDVTPPPVMRDAVRQRVLRRVGAPALTALAQSVETSEVRERLRERILRTIRQRTLEYLRAAVASVSIDASLLARMRAALLRRLQPVSRPFFGSALKWSTACAVFLLLIRAMPLVFLAPVTAESGVQAMPRGSLAMLVGGVWQEIADPVVLRHATLLRTSDDSDVTLIFGSYGVLRMAPGTTVKLYDVSGSPGSGITATLIRGRLWALGLTAPFADGLIVEVGDATVSVNAGSVDLQVDEGQTSVTAYDRGAAVTRAGVTQFLVTGERLAGRDGVGTTPRTVSAANFAAPWIMENLERDAVHRQDIARLQAERREAILPTSVLYPAKRLAEEVDVLFTFSRGERDQKRIQQANTRLREAVALLDKGQEEQASGPLAEYASTLVAMAGDQKDNLVKDIIRNQIAGASVAIGDDGQTVASLELLKEAVASVGASVPLGDLSPRDVEGYVLVDVLAKIQYNLRSISNVQDAARLYEDVRPYFARLLDDTEGTHPLLRREAESLLVSIAALARGAETNDEDKKVLVALADNAQQFLPSEPESFLITEEELARRVQEIYDRIYIFRAPQSRLNQLIQEVRALSNDPNRARILRRLKVALPYGLSQELNTEIQALREI